MLTTWHPHSTNPFWWFPSLLCFNTSQKYLWLDHRKEERIILAGVIPAGTWALCWPELRVIFIADANTRQTSTIKPKRGTSLRVRSYTCQPEYLREAFQPSSFKSTSWHRLFMLFANFCTEAPEIDFNIIAEPMKQVFSVINSQVAMDRVVGNGICI